MEKDRDNHRLHRFSFGVLVGCWLRVVQSLLLCLCVCFVCVSLFSSGSLLVGWFAGPCCSRCLCRCSFWPQFLSVPLGPSRSLSLCLVLKRIVLHQGTDWNKSNKTCSKSRDSLGGRTNHYGGRKHRGTESHTHTHSEKGRERESRFIVLTKSPEERTSNTLQLQIVSPRW